MPSIVEESLGYLGQQTVSYVATCEGGQPRVRAMMLLYIDGAFYYATGTRDAKVGQFMKNSKVEVCVLIGEGEDGGSLRLKGSMEFVTDTETRRRVYECVGFTQSFWDDPQHPDFTLLGFKPVHLQLMRPGTVEIVTSDISI